MPRLFTYGSLRLAGVQMATFGRLLVGHDDALPGFEVVMAWRDGRQLANVVRSHDARRRVVGIVLEVSEAELGKADAYEKADAYTRIPVRLVSGLEAWVYVEAASLD